MGTEIYVLVLLVFMIIGAIIAVEIKNLLSSVIAVGAVGFGLSVSFLFLRAPDLAIVQVAVEVVLLVFLIRATVSRDTLPTTGHIRWPGLITACGLTICIFVFGLFAFRDLNVFGEPVMASVAEAPSNTYLEHSLEETGAANAVTGILLDYRAYDTLGEATVLFAAVIGALAVLRGRSRSTKEVRR